MDVFRTPDERFAALPGYPYAPHYAEVDALRLHHLDEGGGPTVLCFHGEPSWSYLYRPMLDALAANYWKLVPFDMPTGQGDADVGWRVIEFHETSPRERVIAETALQDAETEEDADRTEVRDQEIDEARPAVLLYVMLVRHEEVRRQCHRLPRDHEEIRVIRDQHERHAREEHVILEAHEPRVVVVLEVRRRKERDAERDAAQQQKKKP